MAKKKETSPEETGDETPAQEELFKKYQMKVREVAVPYLKDSKVEWIHHHPGNWTLEAQETLFAFWNKMKEDNPTFNIEAKMQKLFVLE